MQAQGIWCAIQSSLSETAIKQKRMLTPLYMYASL